MGSEVGFLFMMLFSGLPRPHCSLCCAGTLALFWLGCANMSHSQRGALFGTALGSTAGALIGSANGDAGAGAVIGGLGGAMAGAIVGDAEDARQERDLALMERDGAIAQAQYIAQANAQPPLTNSDLIRLSQSGVGEDIILNLIQTRGGQFELGTDSIIALKASGVSDRVILGAQSAPKLAPAATAVPVPVASPGVVVVPAPPPPAVIVEPAPVFWGGYWGPPRHRPHPHPPRGGVDFFFGF
jgi:outer membrane lipoprotein SlyB